MGVNCTPMKLWSFLLTSGLLFTACAASRRPPIRTVPQVDLGRFMGDWYVIANIPTFVEKRAHNAVESYRLDSDGTIATTFTFRKGSFDGEPSATSRADSCSTRRRTRSGGCSSSGRSGAIFESSI